VGSTGLRFAPWSYFILVSLHPGVYHTVSNCYFISCLVCQLCVGIVHFLLLPESSTMPGTQKDLSKFLLLE
jgi:hypothetical protein